MSSRSLSKSTIASELAQYLITNTSESKSLVTEDGYYASWLPPPRLCAFCQNIFDHWHDDEADIDVDAEPTYFQHHGTFSSIWSSAKNGCGLCAQFLNTVPTEILEKHNLELEEDQAS